MKDNNMAPAEDQGDAHVQNSDVSEEQRGAAAPALPELPQHTPGWVNFAAFGDKPVVTSKGGVIKPISAPLHTKLSPAARQHLVDGGGSVTTPVPPIKPSTPHST